MRGALGGRARIPRSPWAGRTARLMLEAGSGVGAWSSLTLKMITLPASIGALLSARA